MKKLVINKNGNTITLDVGDETLEGRIVAIDYENESVTFSDDGGAWELNSELLMDLDMWFEEI